MRFSFNSKPINHRLWKLTFLLSIWAGFELGMTLHSRANDTLHLKQSDRLEYRWPALEKWIQIQKFKRMLYGTKVEVKAPAQKKRPKYGQAPLDAEAPLPQARPAGRLKRKQYKRPQSRKAPGLPLVVQNSDARRSVRGVGNQWRCRTREKPCRLDNPVQASLTTRSSTTAPQGSSAKEAMHISLNRSLSPRGSS